MSSEESARVGRWKPLVKAAIEPMNAVTNPEVREISVLASAQAFKTDFLLNTIMYYLVEEPSHIILSQPQQKALESFSQDKLDKLIESNTCLNSIIKDKRERDSNNTIEEKATEIGSKVTLVSAASIADLASRTVKVVLMDEIDRYKDHSSEGDATTLLRERQNTFFNYKNIAVSTPTTESGSKIWARYQQGSQHEFHLKCPHCGELELPRWVNVKWDKDQPRTASYQCSHCTVLWTNEERLQAASEGVYIAKHPERTSHLSFKCNALCSPFITLEELVKKFLSAKGNASKMQVFVNTSLAEVWQDKAKSETPKVETLWHKQKNYELGIVPKDYAFLTAAVDIQSNRVECAVYAFNQNKEQYLVDHKVFDGSTVALSEPVYKDLEQYLTTKFKVEGSSYRMPIRLTVVDSGYNTKVIYEFCSKYHSSKVRAIDGSDSLKSAYSVSRKTIASNKYLYSVGSSFLKASIMGRLSLNPSISEDERNPEGFIHISQRMGIDYFKQVVSEDFIKNPKTNKWSWQKNQERNEALDLLVYSYSAAIMVGLDRMSNESWEALLTEIDTNEENSKALVVEPPQVQTQKPQNPIFKRNPNLIDPFRR